MRSSHAQRLLQSSLRKWVSQFDSRFQFAVTLTLKPYRNTFDASGTPFRQQLTPALAWHEFAAFQTRLNRSIFKNAARRHGKTLTYLATLEGVHSEKLPHFHCAIGDIPERTLDHFADSVGTAWADTLFGNAQIMVVPYRDSGWLNYMTKEVGADGDEFGWEHVRIGSDSSISITG